VKIFISCDFSEDNPAILPVPLDGTFHTSNKSILLIPKEIEEGSHEMNQMRQLLTVITIGFALFMVYIFISREPIMEFINFILVGSVCTLATIWLHHSRASKIKKWEESHRQKYVDIYAKLIFISKKHALYLNEYKSNILKVMHGLYHEAMLRAATKSEYQASLLKILELYDSFKEHESLLSMDLLFINRIHFIKRLAADSRGVNWRKPAIKKKQILSRFDAESYRLRSENEKQFPELLI
jgi:hypothetical protein